MGAKLEFDIRGEKVVFMRQGLVGWQTRTGTIEPVEHIEILVDRGSIEIFVNHGELSSTRFALLEGSGIALRADNGLVEIKSLEVNPLKAIWSKKRD